MGLDEALAEIGKKHGKGFLFEAKNYPETSCISTGSLAIDQLLGTGGWPRGNLSEIFGRPRGGKTTLAYAAIGQCTAGGEHALYVGAEGKIEPDYMRRVVEAQGGNMDLVRVLSPNPRDGSVLTGEKVWEFIQAAIGVAGIVVLDSFAALVPAVEADADMSDRQPGLQARLVAKALRKTKQDLTLSDTVLLATNQIRDNIGGYGYNETTPSGWAPKFNSIIRCRLANRGTKVVKDVVVGSKHEIKVLKNQRTGKEGQKTNFFISRTDGVDPIEDIMNVSVGCKVVRRAGAYYYWPFDSEDYVAHGSTEFREYLEVNEEVFREIRHETRVALGIEQPENEQEGE